jgi:hypothetical protein
MPLRSAASQAVADSLRDERVVTAKQVQALRDVRLTERALAGDLASCIEWLGRRAGVATDEPQRAVRARQPR